MDTAAKPTWQNRTITIDFRNKSTYFCLLKDGKKLRKNNLTIPC